MGEDVAARGKQEGVQFAEQTTHKTLQPGKQ